MTDSELLSLHHGLIEIPSVSGDESEVMQFATEWLGQREGLEVFWVGRNVVAKTKGNVRLLLNTHLDTVPANPQWTMDPYVAKREGDCIYGLGSNDAKGCAAAMMGCIAEMSAVEGLACLLAVDEETGGAGTQIAWPKLHEELGWHPSGIIVGEPTGLQIGIGQWGLLIVQLVARGTASHAAHLESGGVVNPIFQLAQDLAKLAELRMPGGNGRACPTVLLGSSARNQIPGVAKAVLDIRTEPGQSHSEITSFLASELNCEVEVLSSRLVPYRCEAQCPIAQTAQRVLSQEFFVSHTMSDQVVFQGFDCIKMGPGDTNRSHTADEYLFASELIEGHRAYCAVAQEFLK